MFPPINPSERNVENLRELTNTIYRCNTDTPNNSPYCLVTCQHNGLDQAEPMVRCCICMKWVHPISCCNDIEQDANHAGVYTCSLSRTISERLLNLEKTVDTLHTMNKDLIRLL